MRLATRTMLLVFWGLFATAGCGGIEANVECASNDECFEGYACDADSKHCLRACKVNDDCLSDHQCVRAAEATDGICKPGAG